MLQEMKKWSLFYYYKDEYKIVTENLYNNNNTTKYFVQKKISRTLLKVSPQKNVHFPRLGLTLSYLILSSSSCLHQPLSTMKQFRGDHHILQHCVMLSNPFHPEHRGVHLS